MRLSRMPWIRLPMVAPASWARTGIWVVEPVVGKEGLFTASIDFNRVLEERQNLDVAGHYSRPDVTRLIVNRERQSTLKTKTKFSQVTREHFLISIVLR